MVNNTIMKTGRKKTLGRQHPKVIQRELRISCWKVNSQIRKKVKGGGGQKRECLRMGRIGRESDEREQERKRNREREKERERETERETEIERKRDWGRWDKNNIFYFIHIIWIERLFL